MPLPLISRHFCPNVYDLTVEGRSQPRIYMPNIQRNVHELPNVGHAAVAANEPNNQSAIGRRVKYLSYKKKSRALLTKFYGK